MNIKAILTAITHLKLKITALMKTLEDLATVMMLEGMMTMVHGKTMHGNQK